MEKWWFDLIYDVYEWNVVKVFKDQITKKTLLFSTLKLMLMTLKDWIRFIRHIWDLNEPSDALKRFFACLKKFQQKKVFNEKFCKKFSKNILRKKIFDKKKLDKKIETKKNFESKIWKRNVRKKKLHRNRSMSK